MNIDHCNTHSSFKDRVYMSNLCQEITLPTDPVQHIDNEIALCILSAINGGTIDKRDELEFLFYNRSLDEIIDHQHYPVELLNTTEKEKLSVVTCLCSLSC